MNMGVFISDEHGCLFLMNMGVFICDEYGGVYY